MSESRQIPTDSYLRLVQRLAQTIPGYKILEDFLCTKDHISQSPARFTVVKFKSDTLNTTSQFSLQIDDFDGTSHLAEELESNPSTSESCRLFIVENVCAQTVALLGERFDIDPQFFADHLSNEPWYRIEKVADRIPALPSSQKLHDFLQLRYIETRTISNYQHEFHGPVVNDEPGEVADGTANEALVIPSNAQSFMRPDKTTTRIPRKAGKLNPRTRNGISFETLLCTRQVITVWFQKGNADSQGWTGVILVDPPFRLPPGDTYCTPTGYRSFSRRPSLLDNHKEGDVPLSNRQALVQHLKYRFAANSALLESARKDCFLVLGDLYRLVASNWVVINEYVNREMATIEYILEKHEPNFRDLEFYLKDLYIFRRRCTKYHDLISEAKEQCSKRGQQRWPRNLESDLAREHADDMEEDFIYLQVKVQKTAQRIEKNINLLTALVAIGEGKQALDENHGVARLNLLATVFLPFSTVAAILGMQGNYAPGAEIFWLFWAVSIPLTGFIVGISALYDGFALSIYNQMYIKLKVKLGRKKNGPL